MCGCPEDAALCLMTTLVPTWKVLTWSHTVRFILPRSFLELPLNVPLEFLTIFIPPYRIYGMAPDAH
jgi:hypothetical protein